MGMPFQYHFPRLTFLAKLGDVAYNLLLKFNNVWNKARQKRGKEYYSLSAVVKHKVKQAVSAISGFEPDLASYAKAKGCDGIICGHIHHPEDKMLKGWYPLPEFRGLGGVIDRACRGL